MDTKEIYNHLSPVIVIIVQIKVSKHFKLPILSIFGWMLKTGFTVIKCQSCIMIKSNKMA